MPAGSRVVSFSRFLLLLGTCKIGTRGQKMVEFSYLFTLE